jgi:hypothetical protein
MAEIGRRGGRSSAQRRRPATPGSNGGEGMHRVPEGMTNRPSEGSESDMGTGAGTMSGAETPSQIGRGSFASHVRSSVHYYNTEEEIDRLVQVVARLA